MARSTYIYEVVVKNVGSKFFTVKREAQEYIDRFVDEDHPVMRATRHVDASFRPLENPIDITFEFEFPFGK